MSGLFDDILSSPAASSSGMFDDILKAPSFSDVKGGASSSPSFAGVSGGSAVADAPSDWQFEGTTPQTEEEAAIDATAVDKTLKGVSEIPNALYQGLQSGSNKLGEWATLAGAAPIGLFDDIVGTNLQDKYFENVVQPFTKGAEYNQEQINQMQLPGQIVAGVGQAAPEVGLGLMSGGETVVPRAAAATSEILGTVAGNVVKMSAPLAEKSAGQAYGQAIADGKDPTQATADALAAIGETIAMAAGGGQVEGNIAKRVAAAGAAGGLTGEAVRELKGEEFNAAALGSNVALGAAFGVHGDNVRPEEARLPESAPETSTERPQTSDLRPTEDVPATTLPPEANGPEIARTEPIEASKPRVRFNEETGQFEQAQHEFERQTEHPEDLTPDAHERNIGELFGDLVPESAPQGPETAAAPEIGRWEYNLDTQSTERSYSPADTKRASEAVNTPEPVLRKYHEGTLTTGDLLSDLVKDTSGKTEDYNRRLAGYLQSAGRRLGALNVKISRYNPNNELHKSESAGSSQGYYHPASNAIRLNRDAPNPHLLVHETVHALTNRAVIRGKAGKLSAPAQEAYHLLHNTFEGVKTHLLERKEIFDTVNSQGKTVPNHYGFTNLDEYLAEFMSNGEFRNVLKGVKLSDIQPRNARTKGALDRVRSVYDATISSIRKLLGMPEKAETALDASFAAAHNFISKLEPEALANLPGQVVEPAPMALPKEHINAAAREAIRRGADREAVAARVQQLYKDNGHVQAKPRYKLNPETNQYELTPAPTGTKNAVMEAERTAEAKDPIVREAAKSNQTTLDEAKQAVAENKNLPDEIVERLNSEGVSNISSRDEAVLLLEKARLRNEREEAGKRATDQKLSDAERSVARQKWEDAEAKINALDQATYNSGKEWGRLGQFRQRMIRADYSLASLEQRARVRLNRPLKAEEVQELKPIAEKIEAAQKKVEETSAADEAASREAMFQQFVKQMTYEMKGQKPLARHERLKKLEDWANESREALRKRRLGTTNTGINPTDFFHLARIGAYHIAKGAVKFADWVGKMRGELGDSYDAYKDSLNDVYAAARATHETSAVKSESPEAVKRSIGEKVTQRDVYDLARAHVLNGVHGEKAVMEAVANDLKDRGLDERDVRRIFSDYGKVKFPSKEADKVELRELRQLVQMQESIDRIAEGKPPLKSGTQRDKPSQAVREKRRLLNDKLKEMEKKSGHNPERLATYQDARIRNLKNMIEDIEKQIATGVRPERAKAPADTAEIKTLKEKRDALRAKLTELSNPPPAIYPKDFNVEKQNTLKRQMEYLEKKLATRDVSEKAKGNKIYSEETKKLQDQYKAKKAEYDDLKRRMSSPPEAVNPKDPYEAKNRTEKRALEKQIEDLDRRLKEKDVSKKAGVPDKPTPEVLKLREERDALREEYNTLRQRLSNPPPAKFPLDPREVEAKWQAGRAKSFKEQIARIEERIKNNDYARPEKRVPKPLDDANREAQYELHKAKELFYRKMLNKERSEKGQIAQFFLGAREARNYMRAVMTSIDLSAAGRQGWKLGSANPSIVPNAFFKQLTAMKSESHAYKIQQALEKDPSYNIAKKNGVEFTEDAVHSADKAEEKFMSRWLEVETEGKKGPMLKAIKAWNWLNTPVRASERAYRTYLNVLRLDAFKKLAAAAADSPNGLSDATLKAIANYVNIATGRGKIGMTNKGAGALNEIFFAPRLRASQFNWLFGQPFYKGDATSRKLIREQYARHLAAVGAALTLGYMAHQVSDKPDEKFIEWDPRSTDFGKMRFGDTRIDLMAGLGQATTLLARIATGTTKQANGKIAPLRDSLRFNVDASTLDDTGRMKHDAQGVGDVAGRYLANSLAPDMGYAWHALSGKDFKGDDFNFINESGNLITPMSFGNIKEVMTAHGIPAGTAITLLEMLGASVQHYDNTKRKPPKPTIPEEQRGILK